VIIFRGVSRRVVGVERADFEREECFEGETEVGVFFSFSFFFAGDGDLKPFFVGPAIYGGVSSRFDLTGEGVLVLREVEGDELGVVMNSIEESPPPSPSSS